MSAKATMSTLEIMRAMRDMSNWLSKVEKTLKIHHTELFDDDDKPSKDEKRTNRHPGEKPVDESVGMKIVKPIKSSDVIKKTRKVMEDVKEQEK